MGQGAGQRFHAIPERAEAGARRGFSFFAFAGFYHAAKDAAVFALEAMDFREGGAEAQPLRITCVNSGDHRTHQTIQQIVAELAMDEGRDRFVVLGRMRAAEDFGEEAPLRASAEERRAQSDRSGLMGACTNFPPRKM